MKRNLLKGLKDQEKESDALSKKIMIYSESVMDEVDAMMKIAEERQRKYVERAMKNMRDERQQFSVQNLRKQDDLDVSLVRENNCHIDELVDAKDYFYSYELRLESKLVQSKRKIVK